MQQQHANFPLQYHGENYIMRDSGKRMLSVLIYVSVCLLSRLYDWVICPLYVLRPTLHDIVTDARITLICINKTLSTVCFIDISVQKNSVYISMGLLHQADRHTLGSCKC